MIVETCSCNKGLSIWQIASEPRMERLKVEREHENAGERLLLQQAELKKMVVSVLLAMHNPSPILPHFVPCTLAIIHHMIHYLIINYNLRIAVFWSHFAFISAHGALRTCKPLGGQGKAGQEYSRRNPFAQAYVHSNCFSLSRRL